jgi:anti-anti-sigma regulatory factor
MSEIDDTLVPIDCKSSLDISGVESLHAMLTGALAGGKGVLLRAGDVQRADTAALQLLTAFARDAQLRGVALQWQSPSPAVCRAARLLGLTARLGLDAAA